MKKITPLLAGLLSLWAVATAHAQVQNYSGALPANTVVGRLGIGPGPSQAIPFATFAQQLLANSSMTINGTSCAFAQACTVGSAPIGNNQVLGNVSGGTAGAAGLTQSQLTGLLLPFTTSTSGVVPASSGGISNFLRADGTWTTPSGASCAVGYFCVRNFANPAAAFSAAAAAGGGTVFFDQSVTLSAAQTVGDNIRVECSNRGVVISTSSTTLDLFIVTGNNVTITHCGFAFSGTIGTKTAGALLSLRGENNTVDDVVFSEGCFICIDNNHAGIITNLHNLIFRGNFTAAPAAGSGVILIDNEVTHLSNITVGASPVGNYYDYGIKVIRGAVDGSNLEIITTDKGIWMVPGAGQSNFLKVTTSYLDNCGSVCALLQTSGGTIGYAEFSNVEFGFISTSSTSAGIKIDTVSGGGNIGSVKVSNSEIFNYSAGGSGVSLLGSLGTIMFHNNLIGQGTTNGFNVNSGVSCTCSVQGNSMRGSSKGLTFASVLGNSLFVWNIMNGSGTTLGGNSATNVANNLP